MPTSYLYFDVENRMTTTVNLRRMTLRQYLRAAPMIGFSYACDDGEPLWVDCDDDGLLPLAVREDLTAAALDPNVVWVGHNAASYDVRAFRFQQGIPQPRAIDDTLELAMCAFPNQPGGYSLKRLAQTLGLSQEKIEIDLKAMCRTWPLPAANRAAIRHYGTGDTVLAREVHRRVLPRIPERELAICRLCNAVRELHLVVRPEKVDAAFEGFSAAAAQSILEAMKSLDKDGEEIEDTRLAFGWEREPGTLGEDDPGVPRSIKAEKLKALLLERLGFDTRTISYKKINPVHLAANERAATALQQASRANKALSHKRRTNVFVGVPVVDVELGAWRAHTGRFSSPSTGRGVNLHNQAKRDKVIAKAMREMFELPAGLCMVRADEANVEYRMMGWLTHCRHVVELFERNVFADPYAEFGYAATGQRVTKEDPARQVYKAAVLALAFAMGIGTWMSQLLLLIADRINEVSLEDLERICAAQGWEPITDRWALAQQTKIHAPTPVAMTAFYTRKKFHEIHPEFMLLGKWLMTTVQAVSAAVDPELAIEHAYNSPNAPDRNRLNLSIDPGLSGRTIRATCGPWTQTVAWRDIGLHDTNFGFCLSTVQAGNKGFRKITPNIVLENVASTCARNSICAAKLELSRRGWHYLLSVHDELQIVCSRDRATVLAARRDLIEVLGPGNALGFDWAAVINPDEINVSQSLFERPMGEMLAPIGEKLVKGKLKPVYPPDSEWWRRLEAGETALLDVLP